MSGLKLVLPMSFTDTSLPVLPTVDPIETHGSLFLYEPMHPADPWPAGIPGTAPNLLAEIAADVLGVSPNTLTGTTANGFGSTTRGVVERSGKGGVHVIVSPTQINAANQRWGLGTSSAIKAYMKANMSNSFYLSRWGRITRADTNVAAIHPDSIFSTNGKFAVGFAAAGQSLAGTNLVGSDPAPNVVGPEFRSMAASPAVGFNTDSDTQPAESNSAPFIAGQRGGTTNFTGHGSRIFYRAYMEDLTVSGRTYAEVRALDYELYTKHVLTAGGRYYGDTFTDPATVP